MESDIVCEAERSTWILGLMEKHLGFKAACLNSVPTYCKEG